VSTLRWEWTKRERVFTERVFSNLTVLTMGAPLISECVQLRRLDSSDFQHNQSQIASGNPKAHPAPIGFLKRPTRWSLAQVVANVLARTKFARKLLNPSRA
jgi:hypothetical protein